MTLSLVVLSVLILGMTVLLVRGSIEVVDRAQRRGCAGCREGTVLFLDDEEPLCHKHWTRRDRIKQLEWKMDHVRPDVDREQAMSRLLRKISEMPTVLPTEPGAVSPKPDGSR